jgi:hypothetical protein
MTGGRGRVRARARAVSAGSRSSSTRWNRSAGRQRSRRERAWALTARGTAQSRPSRSTRRVSSATDGTWRQIMANTTATITGRARTRSRNPSRRYSSPRAKATGETNSVRRASTAGLAGAGAVRGRAWSRLRSGGR